MTSTVKYNPETVQSGDTLIVAYGNGTQYVHVRHVKLGKRKGAKPRLSVLRLYGRRMPALRGEWRQAADMPIDDGRIVSVEKPFNFAALGLPPIPV